nr:hypothetical protein [uncultured Sphingobacterium sp.]
MSDYLKRIKLVADREGISVSALEAAIGASKGVFTRALNNGTDIQSKWLISLLENYPDYSAEWLLRGEGSMLCAKSIVKEFNETYLTAEQEGINNAVINALHQVIASQNATIKSQEKIISFMERQLSVYEQENTSSKKE